MTGEALFALLGDLDQALVDGAEAAPERPYGRFKAARRIRFRPAAALAACAAVAALAIGVGGWNRGGSMSSGDSMRPGQIDASENSAPCTDVDRTDVDCTGASDGALCPPGSAVGDTTGDAGPAAASTGFYAVVAALSPELAVAPAEGSPLRDAAELVVLTMTDTAPETGKIPADLRPGETVWVSCDLAALTRRDSTTLEAPVVYAITREP